MTAAASKPANPKKARPCIFRAIGAPDTFARKIEDDTSLPPGVKGLLLDQIKEHAASAPAVTATVFFQVTQTPQATVINTQLTISAAK